MRGRMEGGEAVTVMVHGKDGELLTPNADKGRVVEGAQEVAVVVGSVVCLFKC